LNDLLETRYMPKCAWFCVLSKKSLAFRTVAQVVKEFLGQCWDGWPVQACCNSPIKRSF
jgi:hypothetical protein